MRQISLNEMTRSLHAAMYQLQMQIWEREQVLTCYTKSEKGNNTGLLDDKQVEFIETLYHKHK
jgi:hypothetical protein